MNKLASHFLLIIIILTASCTSSNPTIKLEPTASSFQVGDTLKVLVKAENISDLSAIEVHLSFNPLVLEVIEIRDGGFITADFTVQNTFDNTAGTVDYAIAQIDHPPVNGNGTFFEVTFRAKASGDSPILFSGTNAAPSGIILSDSKGNAIEVSISSGNISVK